MDGKTPTADLWMASGLRMQVLLPLGVGLVLLVASFVVILTLGRMKASEAEIAEAAAAVDVLLQERSSHEVQTMRSIIELILQDKRIEAAFVARDRKALLDLSTPIRDGIWARNGISHFEFILPDNTALLRVDSPGDFGDRVGRFLLEVPEYDKPFWGNELSPQGNFTLQVVYPWRVGDKVIGHLQLGIDFAQLMEGIKTALRADVFVAIDKSHLDAARWKQAQKDRMDPLSWDEFPDLVVINRSLAAIPPPVRAHLSGRAGHTGKDSFESGWNGAVMQTMGVPFTNRKGVRLGELVVMEDITAAASERRRTIAGVLLVAGTAGAGLMLLFYVLLGRIQRRVAARIARLNDIDRVLASEQNERQRAEQVLIAQLERIQQLEARSRMVEELASANQTTETALHRNLEITEQLRTTQSELLASARQAGRAEIATNVLHNVGNVLNSVNVSAGLMAASLRQSRLPSLSRALQLMQDHKADLGEFLSGDDKGKLLPGYLDAVARVLAQEQERQMEELARLVKSIDHIKEIVTTQQSHAGGMGVIEPVNASDLAEDALRLQGGSLVRHDVTVIREFEPVPVLPLDRGRVLQILVNLISNAKNAMSALAAPHPLTLRIELAGASLLRISVQDAGEGITAENLTRIFAHGFTTRPTGHGFGLHSSALAARQMGGTLTASSAGAGKGATFVLELPVVAAR